MLQITLMENWFITLHSWKLQFILTLHALAYNVRHNQTKRFIWNLATANPELIQLLRKAHPCKYHYQSDHGRLKSCVLCNIYLSDERPNKLLCPQETRNCKDLKYFRNQNSFKLFAF